MTRSPAPGARVIYADLVRLLAILMVVMIHTAAPLYTTSPVGSPAFCVGWALDSLSRAAVPLFVMVSGSFLLDESREVSIRKAVKKYALPLIGLYFLWSVLYALANKVILPLAFEGAAVMQVIPDFLKAIPGGAYHLWYLPMLAAVYLISPLLRRFVKRDDPRPAVYFVLLGLALRFAVPTLAALADEVSGWNLAGTVDSFCLDAVAGYPTYFVAGWLMANFRPCAKARAGLYAAGALGLAALAGGSLWLSLKSGAYSDLLMDPLTLFAAAYSAALFGLFAWEIGRRPFGSRTTRWAAALSGCVFGVYVIHVEIQSLFKLVFPLSGDPLVYVLLQWAAVTAVSFAAAATLRRIPAVRMTVRG